MKIQKNKTLTSIVLILLLATSAVMISMTRVPAKTSLALTMYPSPLIGLNSQTEILWIPNPDVLSTDPALSSQAAVWSNAVVTFTRPDKTQDTVNGPFTVRPPAIQGFAAELQLFYTPNMKGTWTVNFYWPGDTNYAAINQTDSFNVGDHIPRRSVWAYVSLMPYPAIGIGQSLLVNAWVTPPPFTELDNYQNYLFTFTKPDGTILKVGPFANTESEGTVWFNIVPDQVGNWTVKLDFPGDYMNLPATTSRTFTVQQAPVNIGYPDTPLPNSKVTFPINTQNRNWRTIEGPWYMTWYNDSQGAFNPYTEAPKTPHILWQIPAYSGLGGYIGSPLGIQTGAANAAYGAQAAGMYSSSVPSINVIMAGRGYYTDGTNIHCVDIKTGKELWSIVGSFNVGAERAASGGGLPVLYSFGARFIAYNALTGAVVLNVTGLSGMTFFDNPYVYLASGNGRVIKWDTTSSLDNFASRVIWNVTDPSPIGFAQYSYSAIQGNLWVSVIDNATNTVDLCVRAEKIVAINLTNGATEYNVPVGDPTNPNTWEYREGPATGSGYGILYTATTPYVDQGRGWTAWNTATGQIAWNSQQADAPWGNFWAYMPMPCGYGMVYASGYSGVYAFNASNGQIVWHFIDNNTYNEDPYTSDVNATNGMPYSSYQFGSAGAIVGGGVVFAPNTEHSPTFFYRGQGLCAINALTGQKLWKILGVYKPTAIAEGVLIAPETANGYTYAFGKGDTSTTVSTQNDVYTRGETILLKGSVLDMSTAQNGTAAISDQDQEAWMEYLHMQQPKPTNAKGVPVHITAIDPNNNFQDLGTVTSDMTGNYALAWTAPIPGVYTVTATFEGSNSYYGSQAESTFAIAPATPTASASPAPAVSPTMPPATQIISPTVAPTITIAPTPSPVIVPPTSAISTEVYVVIGVVIVAIVAAVAALVLRRRKQQP